MTKKHIKTAVIGHPINHSKSPLIHAYWLDKYELNGTYTAIDIAPQNIKQSVSDMMNEGYTGFNVTIPHKIAIMDLCDEIDERARAIGAVNTVTIKDGKLYGSNTDAYGFIENIKQNAPHFDFTKGKALVLGAGGAANAICYALLEEGAPEILLTNRTQDKATALAHQINANKISIHNWENRNSLCTDAHLIVNTTALGMNGKPPLILDFNQAPKNALVTDIVYAPLQTALLIQAQEHNLQTVTGIGMLLHQARPGFEKWNGILPDVDSTLEKLVLKP